MKTATYDGYTNWATWHVALLINNDSAPYELAHTTARNALRRGNVNVDEVAGKFERLFRKQYRETKQYYEDSAADARDARGQYERQQLEGGKPQPTAEELKNMSKDEKVEYFGGMFDGLFYDLGGTSQWEQPWEEVNWREIALDFLDEEASELEIPFNKKDHMLSDADKAELKSMGIVGSKMDKKAMITSDAELANNTHPADGQTGAPVLDGKLEHTERPNVNAMREAIETQSEMEVGKPVMEKQQEVKEGEKAVTVEKGSGTQIIINIAGKKKAMQFSNQATADRFIKDASAKFGSKFSVEKSADVLKMPEKVLHDEDGLRRDMHSAPEFFRSEEETMRDQGLLNQNVAPRTRPFPGKKGFFSPEDAKKFREENQGSNVALNQDEEGYDQWEPVFPKGQENTMKKEAFNFFFPGQALTQFYPELQHEIADYPNDNNTPMQNAPELSGDASIMEAVEASLNPTIVAYISTSPGAAGIGNDGKTQVLEGAPLRKENEIRGPMFQEEFYTNYQGVPGAALNVMAKKAAAGEEKKQFSLFLKRVVGEIAATFIAAYKATNRPPMDKIPGVGEVKLDQVETAQVANAAFNINLGSRVKYLMDKLADNEIQDAINDAWAQAAVWNDSPDGGYVYEVFVRAETIDTDNVTMKYKFITGTKEAE